MSYTNGLDNPELYFQTKLYTGNSSTQSITFDGSENMQPDWVWCKSRNQSDNHALFDSVRGGQKQLRSNTSDAELTRTNAISSFDSNGFSMGSQPEMNSNSVTYVAWNWKAGGSASSNSDGSITTTISANTTAGFSIIKYAGNSTNSTIGHGLGESPEYIIFKEIDGGESWRVHSIHTPNNSSNTLGLNLNSASFSQSNWISAISSSTISIGTDSSFNTSGNNYIAYAFTPKKGYSKFGSYTGNGNADGTFVYTGMKPSFVMMKKTSGNDDWAIFDNKRDIDNVTEHLLRANSSSAEEVHANFKMDFLSNGFKFRTTDGKMNGSGASYIFMAFAESPFLNSTGVPNNAR